MEGINFLAMQPGATGDVVGNRPAHTAIAHGNVGNAGGIASQSFSMRKCSFRDWDIGWDTNAPLYENDENNNSEMMFHDCLFVGCRTGCCASH
jgi:hypothetical protein